MLNNPHNRAAGAVDAGHCRSCARQAGLFDHCHRGQQEEACLRQTRAWAHAARRYAILALGPLGVGILLATVALLTR